MSGSCDEVTQSRQKHLHEPHKLDLTAINLYILIQLYQMAISSTFSAEYQRRGPSSEKKRDCMIVCRKLTDGSSQSTAPRLALLGSTQNSPSLFMSTQQI